MSVTQESVYKQWGSLLESGRADEGRAGDDVTDETRFEGGVSARQLPTYYCASGFAHPEWPVVCAEAPRRIELARWGLVPFWVKDEEQARTMRKSTLNARAETIFQKPAFRSSVIRQRCLVLADGFFEPHHHDGKSYQFYCLLRDHEPFAFAGIYSRWTEPESGRREKTFSIITTASNRLMSIIHNEKKRMPVILDRSDERRWLDPALSKEEVADLLAPREMPELTAYTVSRSVSTRWSDPHDRSAQTPVSYPELAHLQIP